MIRINRKLILLAASALPYWLILSGCTTRNPEFREIKNLRIEKLGISTSKVSLDVVMYNPNNFGVTLEESALDIYIDNRYLGKTVSRTKIIIPKKTIFAVPVTAELNVKNLLANSLNVLLSKEVDVKARGSMRISKAGISKSIPIDYTGRHKITVKDLF